jgi:hypothetical protein
MVPVRFGHFLNLWRIHRRIRDDGSDNNDQSVSSIDSYSGISRVVIQLVAQRTFRGPELTASL